MYKGKLHSSPIHFVNLNLRDTKSRPSDWCTLLCWFLFVLSHAYVSHYTSYISTGYIIQQMDSDMPSKGIQQQQSIYSAGELWLHSWVCG